MKTLTILISAVLITVISLAQVAPDKYWVKFTDKNGTPYSIENPSEFLSQRAIDRREHHGIEITVQDLPVNPTYIQTVVEAGVILHNISKWFNSITVITDDQNVIDEISDLDFVISVEKSSAIPGNGNKKEKPFFANETINEKFPEAQTKTTTAGMSYDYGQAYNQIEMLNGIALHDMGFDGQGMVIVVQDAGFTNANELSVFDYLWNNDKILGYRDFVDPHNPDLFSSHTHGTSVLSTMGGNLPGEIVGTAPQAYYWLLRSEDGGSEYLVEELNWVSAAEFADSVGADVINSSLGYSDFDDPNQSHTYEDMDGNTTPITIGADIAVSKGMIVVTSAGNEGNSSWQYVTAPADGDSVFTIGAVDGNGIYAGFSSTGPTFDGRIKPNVMAQGAGSAVINAYSGEVSSGSGTSFSSPITAGMVACLWQALPEKTNMEIIDILQQSATLANEPNNQYGFGIPDYLSAYDLATDTGLDRSIENDITLKPNPFASDITIGFSGRSIVVDRIDITDLTGKTVYSKSFHGKYLGNYRIQGFQSLKQGIYFVKITSGNRVYTKKAIRAKAL